MKNLDTVLAGKTLPDLQKSRTAATRNKLAPTSQEINQILNLIKEGKDDITIRKTVRRDADGKSFGFTKGQVVLVRQRRRARIDELTPVTEPIV